MRHQPTLCVGVFSMRFIIEPIILIIIFLLRNLLGHDAYLEAMRNHQFVPRELPMGFPRAIRQVLLMGPPTSSHGLPDLALDRAMLGLASQELLAITAILRDHRDQLVAEVERRNPIATRFPDLSCLEAVEMFVSDSSLLADGLGDMRRPMFEQLNEFVADS